MSNNGDSRINKLYGNTALEDASSPTVAVSWKNFIPSDETLLVRMCEKRKTTEGGIFLPDMAQEESTVGEVVAISPSEQSIKVGEYVMVSKTTAGTAMRPFCHEDDNLVILNHFPGRESDIVGKFKKVDTKRD